MTRSRLLLGAVIVLALAALAVGPRSLIREPQEFADLDHLRADSVRQTKDDSRADAERSAQADRQYNDALTRLTEEQRAQYLLSRKAAIEREQTEESERHTEELANLTEQQLTAIVDGWIDRIQKNWNDPEFQERLAKARAEEAETERLQPDLRQIKRELGASDPRVRAMSDELQRRLVTRMQERGIPFPPGFW